MEINIHNFQRKVPIPRAKIIKIVQKAILKLRKKPSFLSIVFVGSRRMRSINNKYLNHDYATDVLTFDLGAGCGEILICPAVAMDNAKSYQASTENELLRYCVHGLLHLAGFDDHQRKDKEKMVRMESILLE